MSGTLFQSKCIADTADGLRDGLCHFSTQSRVALIYAVRKNSPIRVYDPRGLLRGHEPRFKELYLDSDAWRTECASRRNRRVKISWNIDPGENPDLAGLISFNAHSRSIFSQTWFTEHHPDMCNIGPTERWLEHAAWRLSHDFASSDDTYTGISGYFLKEYATHAVRDYIVDQMNLRLGMDSRIRTENSTD